MTLKDDLTMWHNISKIVQVLLQEPKDMVCSSMHETENSRQNEHFLMS